MLKSTVATSLLSLGLLVVSTTLAMDGRQNKANKPNSLAAIQARRRALLSEQKHIFRLFCTAPGSFDAKINLYEARFNSLKHLVYAQEVLAFLKENPAVVSALFPELAPKIIFAFEQIQKYYHHHHHPHCQYDETIQKLYGRVGHIVQETALLGEEIKK